MGCLSRYANEFRVEVKDVMDAIAEVETKKHEERVKVEEKLEEAKKSGEPLEHKDKYHSTQSLKEHMIRVFEAIESDLA